MRITLALLCVLGTSLAGFAQDKNFDLSRYKFPDYKRHELELNFNSSGGSEFNSFETTLLDNTSLGNSEGSDSWSNSIFNLGYHYDHLTRKRVDYIYSSIIGRYDYSKVDNSQEKRKVSSPGIDWNFNGSSRYYLREDKIFVEGLSEFHFYYSERKTIYDNVNANYRKSNGGNFDLSAGMGLGIGRIEQVNDLWQAHYILEKLNRQKSLARGLQEKDVFEFATLSSILKNKRFFDVRLRKIGELQALDSLLHVQGLVNNGDIAYFTTLNDYWSYGNFRERKSGRELSFQLTPQVVGNFSKSNGSPSTSSTNTNLVSKIQFKSSKQFNLMWERNIFISVSNATLLATNGDFPADYPSSMKKGEASLGFGFFPDSRTSFRLTGQYLGYDMAYYEVENVKKYWQNMINLNLEANYYISPQLQITGNINEAWRFANYHSTRSNRMFYNLGLRYAIF